MQLHRCITSEPLRHHQAATYYVRTTMAFYQITLVCVLEQVLFSLLTLPLILSYV